MFRAAESIGGKAKLKRINDRRTKLVVDLTGLTPGASYHGHLHVGGCNKLGPHYQDDPGGLDTPPNELHTGTIVADSNGTASVVVKAQWLARRNARSVFIHDGAAGHHGSPKIACATFPRQTDDDDDGDDDDDEGDDDDGDDDGDDD